MSEDNEKIIYDIEIRTNIDKAKSELGKLKQDLRTSNHEELLVNLNFQGTEKFQSIQQNLAQIRKAIEVLKRDSSAKITLNGADVGLTLEKLRGLEKEWEDLRKKINQGNLNAQIKEQQKLQGELEKTIAKLKQLQNKFNNSFGNNKAFSEKDLHNTIQQAEQLTNKINGLYKQMGMNATLVNPLKDIDKDYDSYFNKTKEKALQAQKEINDAKVTQARKTNAQIVKDEQKAIADNTQAHKSAWETMVKEENAHQERIAKSKQNKKAIDDYYKQEEQRIKQSSSAHRQAFKEWDREEKLKEKQLKKLQSELDKTTAKIEQIQRAFGRSFLNQKAWSTEKFATKTEETDSLVKKANDLNKALNRDVTVINPLEKYKESYNDYFRQTNEYANKVKKVSSVIQDAEKELVNSLEWKNALSERAFEKKKQQILKAKKLLEELGQEYAGTTKLDRIPYEEYYSQSRQGKRDAKFLAEKQAKEQAKLELLKNGTDSSDVELRKVTKANERYNNLIDEANRKKELGIQLSQKDYEVLQKKIKAQKEEIVSLGGKEPSHQLPSREDFNKQAMQNYFSGATSKSLFDMDTVTSYSEKMSRLQKILDTTAYAWERSGRTNDAYKRTMIETEVEINKTAKALERINQQAGKSLSLVDKMKLGLRTHSTWIASSVLASIPMMLPAYGASVMKNVESKFATVEQVMPEIEHAHKASLDKNLSVEERENNLKVVQKEMNEFIKISKQYGVAVEEVIEAGASLGRMYGRGKNGVANTNLLTQQSARIAVADNFSMLQATKGLESALSQFNLQTEDTNQLLINSNRIIDVWTKAAHTGGASANDLTEGVSLAGAAAHQAGISFEFLNAMIATGVRATGRSGNEIGNSIKSFVNSMQSQKSINMLKDFGIDVYQTNADGTKSLRSMEDVVLDISRMMQTTNKDTSNLLLTLAGGKYQVSKLTAILKDYKELVRMTGELNSENVKGFTNEQIDIQLETLSRKLEQMNNSFKSLFVDIGNEGGLDALKSITDNISNIVTGIKELNIAWGSWIKGIVFAVTALKGVPFLFNLVAKRAGIASGAKAYSNSSNNIGSLFKSLGFDWEGNYTKGKAQVKKDNDELNEMKKDLSGKKDKEERYDRTNISLVEKDTKETDRNTNAKEKNAKTNKIQSKEVGNTTNVIKSSTVATKGATNAVGTFSKVVGGASTALGFFGGPVGIAITALSILVPVVLKHIEALGAEANSVQKVTDAMQEEANNIEAIYNAKERAIDTAENLARNYNELQDNLATLSERTEQYTKVSQDSKATMDALKNTLTTLGMTDKEVTALRDENGKIIIENITNQKAKTAEMALADVNSKIKLNNAEAEYTKNKIIQAKERVKSMETEVEAIGLVERAMNTLNAVFNDAQAMHFEELIAQQLTSFNTNYGLIDKLKEEAQKKRDNANMFRGKNDKKTAIKIEEDNIEKLEKRYEKQLEEVKAINAPLVEIQAKLQQDINNTKYGTGGADSNRDGGIVEPSEEEVKKNKREAEKAQKEAEKKEKQRQDYSKANNIGRIIAVENATNYGLRKQGTENYVNATGIDNQDAWYLANTVANMANRPDLAKAIYSQWAYESARFSTVSGENNYAGLKDTNGNYRDFSSMQDFANAYYNDFISRYNLSNVGYGDVNGYVHELKRNGYFTDDEGKYANAVSGIASEISETINNAISTNLDRQYYTIDGEVSSTDLKPNTMTKLNLLAKKHYDQTGEMLDVTSMKRFGDGSSWHDYGEAFDVVSSVLEQDIDFRNKFIKESEQLGLTPLDEYASPSANATGRHLHFSNRDDNATGLSQYETSLSRTSLPSDVGLAYETIKGLGLNQETLNSFENVKDISSFIKATDSAGMNLNYAQQAPSAGDILYTQDGRAFVVNDKGGYIGVNNSGGDNWKDIKNLTSAYTSITHAMGLTLENASQKLGSLKLPDKVEKLTNYRINPEDNNYELAVQREKERTDMYNTNRNIVETRRAIFGEFDSEAYIKEYENEQNNYKNKEANQKYLTKRKEELEKSLASRFNNGILHDIMTKSGYNDWTEISNNQLSKLATEYDNVIGNDELTKDVNAFISLKDAVRGANEELNSAIITMRKLNGFKSAKDEYEYQAKKIQTNVEFWKANYKNETGSYDGFEWRISKRTYEDAKEQIKELTKYINNLISARDTLMLQNPANKQAIESIQLEITNLSTKLKELEKTVEDNGDKLTKQNKKTISSMFHDLIKGGKSFKDVWTNIWDNIAEVALDRLMGIKDSTNPMWDLVTNMLGIGRKRTKTVGGAREAERYVDMYNDTNRTMGMYTARNLERGTINRNQNSTEGLLNFFNRGNKKINTNSLTGMSTESMNLQASQNMLLASQQMLQSTTLDQTNTIQDMSNTIQESAITAQDSINASQNQMATSTFNTSVTQFGTSVNSMALKGGTGGGGDFNWIGMLPGILNLFHTGGSLRKFATGGNFVKNGGIIDGAGTGTSDSILAYLADQGKFIGVSNGEYIMNAKATRKYGNILEQMNLDKFATGGSIAPETYVPTLKNPTIANNIIKQEAQKQNNNNAKMEELLGQQNVILTNMTNQGGSDEGGNVTILNTRASKEEIFSELAKDPRALQRLLGNNRKHGFR